jgi:hypothetical protein
MAFGSWAPLHRPSRYGRVFEAEIQYEAVLKRATCEPTGFRGKERAQYNGLV